jgi:hypothetical protein
MGAYFNDRPVDNNRVVVMVRLNDNFNDVDVSEKGGDRPNFCFQFSLFARFIV